tara:strand:+ start:1180 stop:1437 length:258 start_codon:yes stop_codon:yes gene_type:complete
VIEMNDIFFALFAFLVCTYAATFYWLFNYVSSFISQQVNINDKLINNLLGKKKEQKEEEEENIDEAYPPMDFLYGVSYSVSQEDN